MNTRCKPGDLAVYIGGPAHIALPEHVGRLFRVLRAAAPDVGLPVWDVIALSNQHEGECHDLVLFPLRDPGHDEPDWVSARRPRSADLREDQLSRARAQLLETAS